ncbi:MAG: hypothetical protein KF694_08850 [Mesorhizobium sp.]|nr:hypothetical protein [Mesorhizobium sp.]
MAREPKTRKSETLTIRLDPKTRFILEYLSRLKGQSITTVVERAIIKAADQETLESWSNNTPDGWQDFWDVSEGVRSLKIAMRSEFFPSYDEEKRLAFCKEHWPFFWSSETRKNFLNHYVDVLWPRIDEFVQIHEDQKASDYFAAGNAMRAALSNAKLKAPDWPVAPKKTETSGKGYSRDLDDEIPF